jgi:hypothetical protein
MIPVFRRQHIGAGHLVEMGGDEVRKGLADLGFGEAPSHIRTVVVRNDNTPGNWDILSEDVERGHGSG